jgi:hypothetical protein
MADKAKAQRSLELIPIPAIQKQIVVVRERQVMLDEDLADLYGVETRRLIEQVKRNSERFPPDFMFQLTKDEAAALRSQSATSNTGRGGRRYAPYAFTEQGVAMLSSVLGARVPSPPISRSCVRSLNYGAQQPPTRRLPGELTTSSERPRHGSVSTTSSLTRSSKHCGN